MEQNMNNKPNGAAERRCYTVEDLETMLFVSRPTVYRLLKLSKFPWFKVGSTYRIPKKSFDEWLENCK